MGKMEPSARRSRQGFTLTELLVATAIFLILMSALTALFNSAIHSVRQGYASISVFEQGRTAMSVMSRDLTSAFTAREFGDVYNFYGRHDGFMFVGALDGGQLGRVTYAFHSEEAKRPFRTTVSQPWDFVARNVYRQAARVARENGAYGPAIESAAMDAVNRLADIYNPGGDKDVIEFDVNIYTQSLIRYEESGVGDLDSFNMFIGMDEFGDPVTLDWPYVDPIDPTKDADTAVLDGNQAPQFRYLLGAIDPVTTTTDDFRTLYDDINRIGDPSCPDGGWFNPMTGNCVYLRVLGPQTFDELIKARKREFWLAMLSDEVYSDYPVLALEPDKEFGSTGYWYDEGYGVPNTLGLRQVNEYVVADGIVGLVEVLGADGMPIESVVGSGVHMDILDAEVKFYYSDGQRGSTWLGSDSVDNDGDGFVDGVDEQRYIDAPPPPGLNYFNTVENLRDPDDPDAFLAGGAPASIPGLLNAGVAIDQQDFVAVDSILADNLLGNRSSRKNLGSPLAPRLPEVVTAEFWVTRSKRHPNSPDIIKRFSQTIQLPAASGRDVPATIALSPGATL